MKKSSPTASSDAKEKKKPKLFGKPNAAVLSIFKKKHKDKAGKEAKKSDSTPSSLSSTPSTQSKKVTRDDSDSDEDSKKVVTSKKEDINSSSSDDEEEDEETGTNQNEKSQRSERMTAAGEDEKSEEGEEEEEEEESDEDKTHDSDDDDGEPTNWKQAEKEEKYIEQTKRRITKQNSAFQDPLMIYNNTPSSKDKKVRKYKKEADPAFNTKFESFSTKQFLGSFHKDTISYADLEKASNNLDTTKKQKKQQLIDFVHVNLSIFVQCIESLDTMFSFLSNNPISMLSGGSSIKNMSPTTNMVDEALTAVTELEVNFQNLFGNFMENQNQIDSFQLLVNSLIAKKKRKSGRYDDTKL